MATRPIEIVTATFYNEDVTTQVRSLLQNQSYADNESFKFIPSAPLLGIDPLLNHIKPFIVTWRLKQSNRTLPVEGKPDLPIPAKVQTIRVAEWTPVNIVYSSGSTEADMDLQTFSGWRVLDISWWIADAMAVCKAKKGDWVISRAVFPGADPAPGVRKTLSVTYARSTGKQGSDSAIIAPGMFLEGMGMNFDAMFKDQQVDPNPAETNQLQQMMLKNEDDVNIRLALVEMIKDQTTSTIQKIQ